MIVIFFNLHRVAREISRLTSEISIRRLESCIQLWRTHTHRRREHVPCYLTRCFTTGAFLHV